MAIVYLALEEPDLSSRELTVNFTDTNASFVSEASVYRLLKDHGLIRSRQGPPTIQRQEVQKHLLKLHSICLD
jgi:hypothetical protein